jgi:hypothetical protein
MATRKKKLDSVTLEMPGTTGSAKIVLPKVEKGSHLTVTTFPDGSTALEWDDAALLRDVQEAIKTHELSQLKPNVRAKATTRTKKLKSS